MQTESVGTAVVQAIKAREIKLYTGEEAWELLEKEDFLAGWDSLYETCPWATVFQSRVFITTWYQTYRTVFVPIVITATYGGKLTGLLTLSTPISEFKRKKGRIIGAGKFEAAYQNWLSEAAEGESFIKDALKRVMQQFPAFSLHLRYVSNPAPVQWVNEPYWKKRCLLETNRRPLIEMNDPALDKMYKKTAFRSGTNRLKKLGPIEFERITSREQLDGLFDELQVMYDFRQGAMFNFNQFKDDPFKADFIRALFDQGLLYFTVLRVKDQVFASVSGVAYKDWMYFAGSFITHTPFRAKYYSPGFVQIMMLTQLLKKDGMSVLDLTAGGDFYKGRLATTHDEVHEIVLTNSRFYYIKRYLRHQYFKYLERVGEWPMGKMLVKRKRQYLLKARLKQLKKQGLVGFAMEKVGGWLNPPKDKMFVASSEALQTPTPLSINKDSLSDMLGFEAKGTWKSRWEFLGDAMERYENGETSYSYSEDGRLLASVWVAEKPLPGTNQENAATQLTLHSLYCHPLGHAKQKAFLAAVAAQVAGEASGKTIYAMASNKDKSFCHTLEAIGFKTSDR